ncbi:MAG: DNA repair protein RadA [Proteobacteria bacterium]|nr:DNA repair protein RadA [Pseudomonadota bacterium]
MAKTSTHYVCQNCGAIAGKWAGKCEACLAWNTMVEEVAATGPAKSLAASKPRGKSRSAEFVNLQGTTEMLPRRTCGISEFDRVCGGGLVAGSAVLVGGDPGIGKSTLLLQVLARLSQNGTCAYVSGEESIDQIRLRAQRLGLGNANLQLAATNSVREIVSSMQEKDAPDVIVIDSIQTMFTDVLDSAPGTVAQVRSSAQELITATKKKNTCLLLVGHVTKEGTLAGPRVLEHMVDTVLYFEGERSHHFRILRAVKNRFGATDEIGVFEMSTLGLEEVGNPSALFLSNRAENTSGTAVFAGIEGTRPMLMEIQALVAPSTLGTPRRSTVGWDNARLAMLLAVLETRAGVATGFNDVYLNVTGGLRVNEPAADLAVAAALMSSLAGEAVPNDAVIFGEIGLSGEIRAVSQTDARLKEAAKLGFKQAYLPPLPERKSGPHGTSHGLKLTFLRHVSELKPLFGELPQARKAIS